jgi:hypothetical protein
VELDRRSQPTNSVNSNQSFIGICLRSVRYELIWPEKIIKTGPGLAKKRRNSCNQSGTSTGKSVGFPWYWLSSHFCVRL